MRGAIHSSKLDGSPQQMPWVKPSAGQHRSRPAAPIVEVNAMHPTSPAMPDVMICGRAAQWLPRLAERLIVEAEEKKWQDQHQKEEDPCETRQAPGETLTGCKGCFGQVQLD